MYLRVTQSKWLLCCDVAVGLLRYTAAQQIVRKNAVLSECPFSLQNTVFRGDLVETASHGSVRLYSEDRTLKRWSACAVSSCRARLWHFTVLYWIWIQGKWLVEPGIWHFWGGFIAWMLHDRALEREVVITSSCMRIELSVSVFIKFLLFVYSLGL